MRRTDISKDQLYDLYINRKLSLFQISKLLQADRGTIKRRFRKYNIPIRSKSEVSYLKQANHCSLSKETIEWLNGELLGDGSLERHKYSARFGYSSKYREYIEYVSKTLDNFSIKQCGRIFERATTQIKGKKFKKPAITYQYHSLFYEELLPIRQKWYPEGKKIVPKDIELTPLTCRQWMIGDGCLRQFKDGSFGIILYTDGFAIGDVEFLVSKLNELGFKCTRQPAHNVIYISTHSVKDFLDYIGECPVECYQYKWNYKGRNINEI